MDGSNSNKQITKGIEAGGVYFVQYFVILSRKNQGRNGCIVNAHNFIRNDWYNLKLKHFISLQV